MKINTSWITELQKSLKSAEIPGSFSVNDLIKSCGHSKSYWRNKLKQAIDANLVEFAGHIITQRVDGQKNATPVYKIVGKK